MIKPQNISPFIIDKNAFEQAWQIPASQRLLDGPRLFDLATMFTMAGIRSQHPDADEDEVVERLRERIAIVEKMERVR